MKKQYKFRYYYGRLPIFFLTVILLLGISSISFAQNECVIVLKNGLKLEAEECLEKNDRVYIKMIGEVFEYKKNEIQSIEIKQRPNMNELSNFITSHTFNGIPWKTLIDGKSGFIVASTSKDSDNIIYIRTDDINKINDIDVELIAYITNDNILYGGSLILHSIKDYYSLVDDIKSLQMGLKNIKFEFDKKNFSILIFYKPYFDRVKKQFAIKKEDERRQEKEREKKRHTQDFLNLTRSDPICPNLWHEICQERTKKAGFFLHLRFLGHHKAQAMREANNNPVYRELVNKAYRISRSPYNRTNVAMDFEEKVFLDCASEHRTMILYSEIAENIMELRQQGISKAELVRRTSDPAVNPFGRDLTLRMIEFSYEVPIQNNIPMKKLVGERFRYSIYEALLNRLKGEAIEF